MPQKPDDYANPGSKPDDYAGDDCSAQDCIKRVSEKLLSDQGSSYRFFL